MWMVLMLVALGTVVGGWLARRFPLDKTRAAAAVVAIAGSFLTIARYPTGVWQSWAALVLAVVLSSDLLISVVLRWRATKPHHA